MNIIWTTFQKVLVILACEFLLTRTTFSRWNLTFFTRCPWLEEIQLQDNRLEYIPPSIFSLKSLSTFDVSNNKLTFMPFEMWKATQLKELNLSFNMLLELPIDDVITRERSFSKTRLGKIISTCGPWKWSFGVSYCFWDKNNTSFQAKKAQKCTPISVTRFGDV